MSKSKEQYAPLMAHDDDDYSSSASTIEAGDPALLKSRPVAPAINKILAATCVILLTLLSFQSLYVWREHAKYKKLQYFDTNYHNLSIAGIVHRVANAQSDFNSPNETIAAAAWDSIQSGHGDVIVDPEWAAKQGLPPSFEHPFMPGKSVYILEAYHMIHCLKVLRNHYMALHTPTAQSPKKEAWELEHDVHCFDTLRQHVMCHADYNLMHSEGHNDVGVHQPRMCRDWDALRDWATENSAHWRDHINPRPEGELWWNYDDKGSDGLPVASLGG